MRSPVPLPVITPDPPTPVAKRPLPSQPQMPAWVMKAIEAHRGGKAMKLAWIHPELADDLARFYGASGHVLLHDDKVHGAMGIEPPTSAGVGEKGASAAAPAVERSAGEGDPGLGIAIGPTPIPGAGGGPVTPPTPVQQMINGVPVSPTPAPLPSTTASGNDPQGTGRGGPGTAGSLGGYGYNWVGPGVVFGNMQPGGTQLAYQTYSHWDPSLNGGQGAWVAHAQSAGGGGAGGVGSFGGTFGGGALGYGGTASTASGPGTSAFGGVGGATSYGVGQIGGIHGLSMGPTVDPSTKNK